MKENTFITIALILLSGCVGDAAMKVHGVAPIEKDCKVQLVNAKSGRIVCSENVNGDFNETFVWGVLEGELHVLGICDGVITKKYVDWQMPRDFSKGFEIGDISP